ncbi:MAG: pilus assembly protein CpaB [Clostridia bacterium]|nr:pilus assembly protein CpaB [Clostridia bacterium]
MKNRTVLGLVCIALALVLAFVIAPFVNKFSDSRSEVLRVKQTVAQGHRLTGDDIETVSVGNYNLPADVLTNPEEVIGKYAAVGMTKGDYLFASKLTDTADTANDVFKSLDGSQVAVSVTIPSFAGGLSGKLQNGDIVSMIVYSAEKKESASPEALKSVRVITATTAAGLDKDELVQKEDGTYELPTTLTLLVTDYQAKLLAEYENYGKMHAALVCRDNEKQAKKFLKEQADVLKELLEKEAEEEEEGEDLG